MKNNAILLIVMLITIPCLAQEEIWVSHAILHFDDIEIGLLMDKPTSKFELINIDTMVVTDNRGNILKENKNTPLNYNYNNGRAEASRFIAPKRRARHLHIKGVMNYFTPSKENNSYFDLGKNKAIAHNINLIDKNILSKNPDLYFSIVDSTVINKVFPDFKYKIKDSDPFRKIDFNFFDIIYAYRYTDDQKIVYFINDDPDPGYNNLTMEDRKTGIMYVLTKLKRGITQSELDEIHIELMIENDESIRKIPFEINKATIE